MVIQHQLKIKTKSRKIYDITDSINEIIKDNKVLNGICNIFCQHTSCSLIFCENYDKNVKIDIETYFSRIVKDGDKSFLHISEGEDDMSSHIRTMLTQNEITIPIKDGVPHLGKWQGINLYEHRYNGKERNIFITIVG